MTRALDDLRREIETLRDELRRATSSIFLTCEVTAVDPVAKTITFTTEDSPEPITVDAVFDAYPRIGSRIIVGMNGADPIPLAQLGAGALVQGAPIASYAEDFESADGVFIGRLIGWSRSGYSGPAGTDSGVTNGGTFALGDYSPVDLTEAAFIRAEVDVGSADMFTQGKLAGLATLSGTPGPGEEFLREMSLFARLTNGAPILALLIAGGAGGGWQASLVEVGGSSQVIQLAAYPRSGAAYGNVMFVDSPALFAVDDVWKLEVTGAGLATVVRLYRNGDLATELSGSNLVTALADNGWPADGSDLPDGQRGGLGIIASAAGAAAFTTPFEDAWDDFLVGPVV